ELIERCDQRLGHVATAVGAEATNPELRKGSRHPTEGTREEAAAVARSAKARAARGRPRRLRASLRGARLPARRRQQVAHPRRPPAPAGGGSAPGAEEGPRGRSPRISSAAVLAPRADPPRSRRRARPPRLGPAAIACPSR